MSSFHEFVYFIRATESGRIKIGHARNPLSRLAALQTASPEPLELIGFIAGDRVLEQRLHHVHKEDRLGGEWFRPSDGLLFDIFRRLSFHPKPELVESMPPEMTVASASSAWGRIGAHTKWANCTDRSAATAPARAALEQKFLDEADGDPVRAESVRKAYFARLALKSAQARAARKAASS